MRARQLPGVMTPPPPGWSPPGEQEPEYGTYRLEPIALDDCHQECETSGDNPGCPE